jgi:hypothetical protein
MQFLNPTKNIKILVLEMVLIHSTNTGLNNMIIHNVLSVKPIMLGYNFESLIHEVVLHIEYKV